MELSNCYEIDLKQRLQSIKNSIRCKKKAQSTTPSLLTCISKRSQNQRGVNQICLDIKKQPNKKSQNSRRKSISQTIQQMFKKAQRKLKKQIIQKPILINHQKSNQQSISSGDISIINKNSQVNLCSYQDKIKKLQRQFYQFDKERQQMLKQLDRKDQIIAQLRTQIQALKK